MSSSKLLPGNRPSRPTQLPLACAGGRDLPASGRPAGVRRSGRAAGEGEEAAGQPGAWAPDDRRASLGQTGRRLARKHLSTPPLPDFTNDPAPTPSESCVGLSSAYVQCVLRVEAGSLLLMVRYRASTAAASWCFRVRTKVNQAVSIVSRSLITLSGPAPRPPPAALVVPLCRLSLLCLL